MRSQLNAAKTCTIGENSIGDDQRCFDGNERNKGVTKLKRIGTIASILIIASGLAGSAAAADGILLKDEAGKAGASYCHMKFPAMDENTLAENGPQLKPSESGDVIDFYGACDESPTGKDQVMAQRREEQYRFETDYAD
jgi:hypothetical protein